MTPPQHLPIDWARYEPGGADYNRIYAPEARRSLYIQIVNDLSIPPQPGTRLWTNLVKLAPMFGLPLPQATIDDALLDYLDRCLDTWENAQGRYPTSLPHQSQ